MLELQLSQLVTDAVVTWYLWYAAPGAFVLAMLAALMGWVTVYKDDNDLIVSNAPAAIVAIAYSVAHAMPPERLYFGTVAAREAVIVLGFICVTLCASWSISTAVSANRSMVFGVIVGLLKLAMVPVSLLIAFISLIDVSAPKDDERAAPAQPPQTARDDQGKSSPAKKRPGILARTVVRAAAWILRVLTNGDRTEVH